MADTVTVIYLVGAIIAACLTWHGNAKYGQDHSGIFYGLMWPVFALGIIGYWIARLATPSHNRGVKP